MGRVQKIKIKQHGGSGRKQGRKLKFDEETTTFSCRIPISKKPELKLLVENKIAEWLQGINKSQ